MSTEQQAPPDWRAAVRDACAFLHRGGFAGAYAPPPSSSGVDIVGAGLVARVDWSTRPVDRGTLRALVAQAEQRRAQPVVFALAGLEPAAAEYATARALPFFAWAADGWRAGNDDGVALLAAASLAPASPAGEAEQAVVASTVRRALREVLTERGVAGRLDVHTQQLLDEFVDRVAARGGDPVVALRAELRELTGEPAPGPGAGPHVVLAELAGAALARLGPGPVRPLPPHRTGAPWRAHPALAGQTGPTSRTAPAPCPRRGGSARTLLTGVMAALAVSVALSAVARPLLSRLPTSTATPGRAGVSAPGQPPSGAVGAAAAGVPGWVLGACADRAGSQLTLVPCAGPHQLVALAQVAPASTAGPSAGAQCPTGTLATRPLPDGGTQLCFAPAP